MRFTDKRREQQEAGMDSMLLKVSDLTGAIVQPEREYQLTNSIVEQHLGFDEPNGLDFATTDVAAEEASPM